jgi:hypothetical protein
MFRHVTLCQFTIDYVRLMYLMLRGLVTDGDNMLRLTSLSQQFRFVYVLYI